MWHETLLDLKVPNGKYNNPNCQYSDAGVYNSELKFERFWTYIMAGLNNDLFDI